MARAQKKSAKAVLSDAAKALMEEASAFNYQRKAAMAWARGVDHAGDVEVKPTQDFDLNRTIFINARREITSRSYWGENF